MSPLLLLFRGQLVFEDCSCHLWNVDDLKSQSICVLISFTHFSSKRTEWKFQTFSAIQILREINSSDSRSSKTAIFAILDALNFDFLQFLSAESDQK